MPFKNKNKNIIQFFKRQIVLKWMRTTEQEDFDDEVQMIINTEHHAYTNFKRHQTKILICNSRKEQYSQNY
jgi:hypothetical protein